MKNLLLSAFVCFSLGINAQSLSPEVIASAGNYFENGNVSLSWTLGEPIVETYTSANLILTQGFQQPELLTVGIAPVKMYDFSARLFPNPAQNSVRLDLKYSNTSTLRVDIYSTEGRILKSENFDVVKNQANNFQFDLSSFSAGLYHIRLSDNGKLVESFKVEKIQD